jgi:hypothetical protein
MPLRVAWEDKYCIACNSTLISTNDSTTSIFAGTKGIGLTTNGLLLDEHPSINPGIEITTTPKTTGLAELSTGASAIGKELTLVRKRPAFSTGAMGLTQNKMTVFGWSLFQKGVTEGAASTYTKTMIPYVAGQPDCEMWLEIGRSIGDPASATGYGHVLTGCICTSMAISGSQGERFTMNCELMGRTFRDNYIHTASNFTPETAADHVFLNYSWTLGGTAANLQSVNFTITNNATALGYNSLVPTAYSLGRIGVSGEFSLAMSTATIGDNAQIDNWVSGTDLILVGTYTATTIFSINMHYTGASVDPAETELLLSLPFEGIYDGTNHAIQITNTDSINYSIPA